MVERQTHFRDSVDAVLSELLLQSLTRWMPRQSTEALESYVDKQQEKWRQPHRRGRISQLRAVVAAARPRMARDYLTAMDDLWRRSGCRPSAKRDPKIEHKSGLSRCWRHAQNIDRDIA